MALRLAGEEHSVVQGLDEQGWLREITPSDASPGLKVNQKGTGRLFDLQDGGSSVLYALDGGDIVATRALDLREPLKNTGAINGGTVVIDDEAQVVSGVGLSVSTVLNASVYDIFLNPTLLAVRVKNRTAHLADSDIPASTWYQYVLNDGANRQFVVKHKDAIGVVRTGVLNLT